MCGIPRRVQEKLHTSAGIRRIIPAAQRGHLNGVEASIQAIPRCSLRRLVVDDIGGFGAILGARLAHNENME